MTRRDLTPGTVVAGVLYAVALPALYVLLWFVMGGVQ